MSCQFTGSQLTNEVVAFCIKILIADISFLQNFQKGGRFQGGGEVPAAVSAQYCQILINVPISHGKNVSIFDKVWRPCKADIV